MSALPYVVGTDIATITRKLFTQPKLLAQLVHRTFHRAEIASLRERSPELSKILSVHAAPAPTGVKNLKISDSDTDIEDDTHSDQPGSVSIALQHLVAGRWAAKEAARKAWGANLISAKDIRIEPTSNWASEHLDQDGMSSPLVAVCQPLGESQEYATSYRQEGQLSISHDADYCVATVIAEPLSLEIRNVFLRRHGLYNSPPRSPIRKVIFDPNQQIGTAVTKHAQWPAARAQATTRPALPKYR